MLSNGPPLALARVSGEARKRVGEAVSRRAIQHSSSSVSDWQLSQIRKGDCAVEVDARQVPSRHSCISMREREVFCDSDEQNEV